ncbi:dTDP-4-dehydrorhamnose reductase [Rahnella selenatireducens]|uniref:dTDP-4-dehydrorhamnose reductase n=1 Tax=Rahnella selenatireducens TaxID=3389797 RepID=UPI00396863AA
MRVLLTGANGQLGRCFIDQLPEGWEILATESKNLDITDSKSVMAVVTAFRPDVIVNAAAYTAVDLAENDTETAKSVNIQGPLNLALAARNINCRLVHVSTDYVFDGNCAIPYHENDMTNPLSVYGKTKLDGETAVMEIRPCSLIVRTAWVFSEYGNNFLKTMLRLAKDRDVLGVVSDQHGCPTYAGDIAVAIIELLQKDAEGGIYHYCGHQDISWSGFAEFIFSTALVRGILVHAPQVKPITTEEYPTVAKRPKYSLLNCGKINAIGIKSSDWQEKVNTVMLKMKDPA